MWRWNLIRAGKGQSWQLWAQTRTVPASISQHMKGSPPGPPRSWASRGLFRGTSTPLRYAWWNNMGGYSQGGGRPAHPGRQEGRGLWGMAGTRGQAWGEGAGWPGSRARPGEEGSGVPGEGRGEKRLLGDTHSAPWLAFSFPPPPPPLQDAAALPWQRGGRGGWGGAAPPQRPQGRPQPPPPSRCGLCPRRAAGVPARGAKWRSRQPAVRFLLLRRLLTPFCGWGITYEVPLPQAHLFHRSFEWCFRPPPPAYPSTSLPNAFWDESMFPFVCGSSLFPGFIES